MNTRYIFMLKYSQLYTSAVSTYNSDKMDQLEQLFSEDQTMAKKLLNISVREIRILVTGKTGTGKSALINGILGDNMTVEGSSLDPETTEVEQFTKIVNGIPLVVFDSPGLQDGTKNEKKYLLDMEQRCKKVDLVLYTLKMTDTRLTADSDDVEAMKKLTNAFGTAFWENVMFVMTFANQIRDPEYRNDEVKNTQHYQRSLGQWEGKLPLILENELNVTRKVAEHVPVVPAGYYNTPHLPGCRYWFSQFWRAVLYRMEESSKDIFFHFNKDRYRRVYEVTPEDLVKDLDQQPIYMPGKMKNSTLENLIKHVWSLNF